MDVGALCLAGPEDSVNARSFMRVVSGLQQAWPSHLSSHNAVVEFRGGEPRRTVPAHYRDDRPMQLKISQVYATG